MKECSQCRSDYHEFSVLVTRELPRSQRNVLTEAGGDEDEAPGVFAAALSSPSVSLKV